MKITSETLVSTTELAAVLGVSARRVQQLAQDAVIIAAENTKGKFPLADSVQRYITFVTSGNKTEEQVKLEMDKLKYEVKIKSAKATKATLEADELEGKMHRSEDVLAVTQEMIFAFRSGLQALPGRLAVDILAAETSAEAAEIVRREVNLVMEEVKNFRYEPEKYKERVRDRLSLEPDDE